MELVVLGVAMQALAFVLLALLRADSEGGDPLVIRLREDGASEQVPDDTASLRRRQVLRGVLGLFVGGTMLALLGVPRL